MNLLCARFAKFFDAVKRDKESRTLVMSSEDEDRFTELGNRVCTIQHASTVAYRNITHFKH